MTREDPAKETTSTGAISIETGAVTVGMESCSMGDMSEGLGTHLKKPSHHKRYSMKTPSHEVKMAIERDDLAIAASQNMGDSQKPSTSAKVGNSISEMMSGSQKLSGSAALSSSQKLSASMASHGGYDGLQRFKPRTSIRNSAAESPTRRESAAEDLPPEVSGRVSGYDAVGSMKPQQLGYGSQIEYDASQQVGRASQQKSAYSGQQSAFIGKQPGYTTQLQQGGSSQQLQQNNLTNIQQVKNMLMLQQMAGAYAPSDYSMNPHAMGGPFFTNMTNGVMITPPPMKNSYAMDRPFMNQQTTALTNQNLIPNPAMMNQMSGMQGQISSPIQGKRQSLNSGKRQSHSQIQDSGVVEIQSQTNQKRASIASEERASIASKTNAKRGSTASQTSQKKGSTSASQVQANTAYQFEHEPQLPFYINTYGGKGSRGNYPGIMENGSNSQGGVVLLYAPDLSRNKSVSPRFKCVSTFPDRSDFRSVGKGKSGKGQGSKSKGSDPTRGTSAVRSTSPSEVKSTLPSRLKNALVATGGIPINSDEHDATIKELSRVKTSDFDIYDADVVFTELLTVLNTKERSQIAHLGGPQRVIAGLLLRKIADRYGGLSIVFGKMLLETQIREKMEATGFPIDDSGPSQIKEQLPIFWFTPPAVGDEYTRQPEASLRTLYSNSAKACREFKQGLIALFRQGIEGMVRFLMIDWVPEKEKAKFNEFDSQMKRISVIDKFKDRIEQSVWVPTIIPKQKGNGVVNQFDKNYEYERDVRMKRLRDRTLRRDMNVNAYLQEIFRVETSLREMRDWRDALRQNWYEEAKRTWGREPVSAVAAVYHAKYEIQRHANPFDNSGKSIVVSTKPKPSDAELKYERAVNPLNVKFPSRSRTERLMAENGYQEKKMYRMMRGDSAERQRYDKKLEQHNMGLYRGIHRDYYDVAPLVSKKAMSKMDKEERALLAFVSRSPRAVRDGEQEREAERYEREPASKTKTGSQERSASTERKKSSKELVPPATPSSSKNSKGFVPWKNSKNTLPTPTSRAIPVSGSSTRSVSPSNDLKSYAVSIAGRKSRLPETDASEYKLAFKASSPKSKADNFNTIEQVLPPREDKYKNVDSRHLQAAQARARSPSQLSEAKATVQKARTNIGFGSKVQRRTFVDNGTTRTSAISTYSGKYSAPMRSISRYSVQTSAEERARIQTLSRPTYSAQKKKRLSYEQEQQQQRKVDFTASVIGSGGGSQTHYRGVQNAPKTAMTYDTLTPSQLCTGAPMTGLQAQQRYETSRSWPSTTNPDQRAQSPEQDYDSEMYGLENLPRPEYDPHNLEKSEWAPKPREYIVIDPNNLQAILDPQELERHPDLGAHRQHLAENVDLKSLSTKDLLEMQELITKSRIESEIRSNVAEPSEVNPQFLSEWKQDKQDPLSKSKRISSQKLGKSGKGQTPQSIARDLQSVGGMCSRSPGDVNRSRYLHTSIGGRRSPPRSRTPGSEHRPASGHNADAYNKYNNPGSGSGIYIPGSQGSRYQQSRFNSPETRYNDEESPYSPDFGCSRSPGSHARWDESTERYEREIFKSKIDRDLANFVPNPMIVAELGLSWMPDKGNCKLEWQQHLDVKKETSKEMKFLSNQQYVRGCPLLIYRSQSYDGMPESDVFEARKEKPEQDPVEKPEQERFETRKDKQPLTLGSEDRFGMESLRDKSTDESRTADKAAEQYPNGPATLANDPATVSNGPVSNVAPLSMYPNPSLSVPGISGLSVPPSGPGVPPSGQVPVSGQAQSINNFSPRALQDATLKAMQAAQNMQSMQNMQSAQTMMPGNFPQNLLSMQSYGQNLFPMQKPIMQQPYGQNMFSQIQLFAQNFPQNTYQQVSPTPADPMEGTAQQNIQQEGMQQTMQQIPLNPVPNPMESMQLSMQQLPSNMDGASVAAVIRNYEVLQKQREQFEQRQNHLAEQNQNQPTQQELVDQLARENQTTMQQKQVASKMEQAFSQYTPSQGLSATPLPEVMVSQHLPKQVMNVNYMEQSQATTAAVPKVNASKGRVAGVSGVSQQSAEVTEASQQSQSAEVTELFQQAVEEVGGSSQQQVGVSRVLVPSNQPGMFVLEPQQPQMRYGESFPSATTSYTEGSERMFDITPESPLINGPTVSGTQGSSVQAKLHKPSKPITMEASIVVTPPESLGSGSSHPHIRSAHASHSQAGNAHASHSQTGNAHDRHPHAAHEHRHVAHTNAGHELIQASHSHLAHAAHAAHVAHAFAGGVQSVHTEHEHATHVGHENASRANAGHAEHHHSTSAAFSSNFGGAPGTSGSAAPRARASSGGKIKKVGAKSKKKAQKLLVEKRNELDIDSITDPRLLQLHADSLLVEIEEGLKGQEIAPQDPQPKKKSIVKMSKSAKKQHR